YGDRELLAGDRVDEALEERWQSRRFHTTEARGERTEKRITVREAVERGEVDLDAENADQNRLRGVFGFPVEPRPRKRDGEPRRVGLSLLDDSDFDRAALKLEHALVGAPIPAVDSVMGPPAQRPSRQVKPIRRQHGNTEVPVVHLPPTSVHLSA